MVMGRCAFYNCQQVDELTLYPLPFTAQGGVREVCTGSFLYFLGGAGSKLRRKILEMKGLRSLPITLVHV